MTSPALFTGGLQAQSEASGSGTTILWAHRAPWLPNLSGHDQPRNSPVPSSCRTVGGLVSPTPSVAQGNWFCQNLASSRTTGSAGWDSALGQASAHFAKKGTAEVSGFCGTLGTLKSTTQLGLRWGQPRLKAPLWAPVSPSLLQAQLLRITLLDFLLLRVMLLLSPSFWPRLKDPHGVGGRVLQAEQHRRISCRRGLLMMIVDGVSLAGFACRAPICAPRHSC